MPVTRWVGIASIRATPSKSFKYATPRSQPVETSTLSHGMGASDLVRCRRHLKFTIFQSKFRSAGAGRAVKIPRAAIAIIEPPERAAQFQIFIVSLQRRFHRSFL